MEINKIFGHTNNSHQEIMLNISMINQALSGESFDKKLNGKDHNPELIELLSTIKGYCNVSARAISEYIHSDELYIHHKKKKLLTTIIELFLDLSKRAEFYITHKNIPSSTPEQILSVLKKYFELLTHIFNEYSSYGSIYLFRHCEKEKKRDKDGNVKYVGIPKVAVRTQALKRAKQIMREVLISPKKVRIHIFHSEIKRTELFANLVEHVVRGANHYSIEEKVEFVHHGIHPSLRSDAWWTKEAEDELVKFLIKGMEEKKKGFGSEEEFFTIFLHQWWHNNLEKYAKSTGLGLELTHQPQPQKYAKFVENFLHIAEEKITDVKDNYYEMVLGFSHSGVVDALILDHYPETMNEVGHIIATASFCKVECEEFCYLGKWTSRHI